MRAMVSRIAVDGQSLVPGLQGPNAGRGPLLRGLRVAAHWGGRKGLMRERIGRGITTLAALISAAGIAWITYKGTTIVPNAVRYAALRTHRYGTPTRSLSEVQRKPIAPFRVRGPDGSVETVDLSRRSALLLVFQESCAICATTMPRWLEMVVEAQRRGTEVMAISVGAPANQAAYWGAFGARIPVFGMVRDSIILEQFGVTQIPATVAVVDGRLAHVAVGVPGASVERAIWRAFGGS